jgi:hypothetical protein
MSAVLDFIAEKPAGLQRILRTLRHWILEASPKTTEKISFKIPFFYHHGMLCYLNPVQKDTAVDIGFCRGFELSNEQGWLEARKRNTIKSFVVHDIADLDQEIFLQILHEAMLINELHAQEKKRKR